MKKVLLMLMLVAAANAGMFSTVSGMIMDEKKPNYAYTVDTNGFNPRVYEFTPKSNPNYVCIYTFISGDKTVNTTMQCFPKAGK
jgi:hypothetical protein